MMNDFNLLSGIQRHIRQQLPEQSIYLTMPPQAAFPCAVLEAEEITMNLRTSKVRGRVKFRMSCMSQSVGEAENSHQAAELNATIDGSVLPLQDGNQAIIRYITTARELHPATGRKIMLHFYEALIRKNEEPSHG